MKHRKGRNAKRSRVDFNSATYYRDDFEDLMNAFEMESFGEFDSDSDEEEEFDLAAWRADLAIRSAERNVQRNRDIKRGLYGFEGRA